VAVAVLTTYGVVAFLWGAYSGTSFPALLSGQSFWSRLPRVLQGVFIGALVVVPGALIYNVVGVLRRSRAPSLKGGDNPFRD
jgi:ABC-type enterobactin transport system permease subunit